VGSRTRRHCAAPSAGNDADIRAALAALQQPGEQVGRIDGAAQHSALSSDLAIDSLHDFDSGLDGVPKLLRHDSLFRDIADYPLVRRDSFVDTLAGLREGIGLVLGGAPVKIGLPRGVCIPRVARVRRDERIPSDQRASTAAPLNMP
jgi:hypothetical protein